MIARIWKGETPESKADQYFDFLKVTGIKDYQETKGNQGVLVLRRLREGRAEFLLLSLSGNLGMRSANLQETMLKKHFTIPKTRNTFSQWSRK
jgi:hypothetical protein